MAYDLNNLADWLDKTAARLPTIANEKKKEAATVVLTDLTQVTPADTGQAISNWQASLDAPNFATIPAHSPSPKGRMVKGKWTHAVSPEVTAQANVPITFELGRAVIESAGPGEPIYIANALPYIERLNSGSSEQAPAGFVDRAVILARSVMDRVKNLL